MEYTDVSDPDANDPDNNDPDADETNADEIKYIRGLSLLAKVDGNGNITRYVHNAHGDVTALVDEDNEVVKEYDYDAFGNERDIDQADTNPFRYCGEYQDLCSGLIYLRNRYYMPSIGRFITEDPICDGLNWYAYCGNNPIKYIDPWGLWMEGDETLSPYARVYIEYYTDMYYNAYSQYKRSCNSGNAEGSIIAQNDMTNYSTFANSIRNLDSEGKVFGCYYDVPSFQQCGFNLCWATSQAMIENYYSGCTMDQQEAFLRSVEIAKSIYGEGISNWNRGGIPTNIVSEQLIPITSKESLKSYLSDGPVYGVYDKPTQENSGEGHMVVITGVVSAPGHNWLVTSNNPQFGSHDIQTFLNFMTSLKDEKDRKFLGIYQVEK